MDVESVVTNIFGFKFQQASQDGATFRQFVDGSVGVDSLPGKGAIFHAGYPLENDRAIFFMSRMFRTTEALFFEPSLVPGIVCRFISAYKTFDASRWNICLPDQFPDRYMLEPKWTHRRAINVSIAVTKDDKDGHCDVTSMFGVTRFQTRIAFRFKWPQAPTYADYMSVMGSMIHREDILSDLTLVYGQYMETLHNE